MINNKAFKEYSNEYDEWFEKNCNIYDQELAAFRSLNISGKVIEIGIGTGKFAAPLGIKYGIDPTFQMMNKLDKDIHVAAGVAENIPLKSSYFDWCVMVTTICFVSDPFKSIAECKRILKNGGKLAIGYVDSESPLGRQYLKKKDKSRFYKEAKFYSSHDILELLKANRFEKIDTVQTVFPDSCRNDVIKEGYGEGSFIVMTGIKL